MKKLCVLYVPGLGDARVNSQRLVLRSWRLWGVEAELFQMQWASDEPWASKLERLLGRIDELAAAHEAIGLVGTSAGASAVINAYAARRAEVVGCVLIAGKINHANTIRENYRRTNPAFVQSAQAGEKALAHLNASDRTRMLSRYATIDRIISRPDSQVAGAHNQMVPTFGHAFTIGTQLIFGAPSFLRFLKHQARLHNAPTLP
jgi:predicted alpha/beta hydrolase family esterase